MVHMLLHSNSLHGWNTKNVQSTLPKSNPLGLKKNLRLGENLTYVGSKIIEIKEEDFKKTFDLRDYLTYANSTEAELTILFAKCKCMWTIMDIHRCDVIWAACVPCARRKWRLDFYSDQHTVTLKFIYSDQHTVTLKFIYSCCCYTRQPLGLEIGRGKHYDRHRNTRRHLEAKSCKIWLLITFNHMFDILCIFPREEFFYKQDPTNPKCLLCVQVVSRHFCTGSLCCCFATRWLFHRLGMPLVVLLGKPHILQVFSIHLKQKRGGKKKSKSI